MKKKLYTILFLCFALCAPQESHAFNPFKKSSWKRLANDIFNSVKKGVNFVAATAIKGTDFVVDSATGTVRFFDKKIGPEINYIKKTINRSGIENVAKRFNTAIRTGDPHKIAKEVVRVASNSLGAVDAELDAPLVNAIAGVINVGVPLRNLAKAIEAGDIEAIALATAELTPAGYVQAAIVIEEEYQKMNSGPCGYLPGRHQFQRNILGQFMRKEQMDKELIVNNGEVNMSVLDALKEHTSYFIEAAIGGAVIQAMTKNLGLSAEDYRKWNSFINNNLVKDARESHQAERYRICFDKPKNYGHYLMYLPDSIDYHLKINLRHNKALLENKPENIQALNQMNFYSSNHHPRFKGRLFELLKLYFAQPASIQNVIKDYCLWDDLLGRHGYYQTPNIQRWIQLKADIKALKGS